MKQSATAQKADELSIPFRAADLEEMVQSLFGTMLNLPVQKVADDISEQPGDFQFSISITGPWEAKVFMAANEQISKSIASAMFGIHETELSDADTNDAMGEVINIVGGNIKGFVDQNCVLSLPCIESLPDDILVDSTSAFFRADDEGAIQFAITH